MFRQVTLCRLCAFGLLVTTLGATAQAQLVFDVVDTTPLLRFGPVDPENGYPIWIEDANGLVLEMCFDTNDVNPGTIDPETGAPFPPCPACVDPLLDLPDPTLPQSFPDNFPDEHFYWLAESIMIENDNSRSIITMALEGAFDGLGAVVDGEQVVFTRYRVRIDNATPGETYQITYPYGITYAVAENDQGGAAISNINFTNDIFLWKGVPLKTPLTSTVGTFLTSVTPPAPPPANPGLYVGDFCGGGPAQGSPFGTDFFSIVGPDAGILQSTVNTTREASVHQCDPLSPEMVAAFDAYDEYHNRGLSPTSPQYSLLPRIPSNCIRSNNFTILAKPTTKKGVQVDRASYNRNTATAGQSSTQINVWARSFEGQNIELTIPGVANPIPMQGDGTGGYFAHVLQPGSFVPPATVTVTNLTDDPPRSTTDTLKDRVRISSATYHVGTDPVVDPSILTVSAGSLDDTVAGTSLSMGASPLDASGQVSTVMDTPPYKITITSANGGTATRLVDVVGSLPDVLAAAGGTVVVAKGTVATLDASASVGLGLTYDWVQTGGTDITLDPLWDPTSPSPSFTFPAVDDLLTFTLTVTDQNQLTSTDTAIVTNTVIAVAGPDMLFSAFPDAGVTLDASASQGAGLSYDWVQIPTDTTVAVQCAGETLDLPVTITPDPTNPALASLAFPLEGGCISLEVTVSGPGGTSTDAITIKAPIGAPIANAGVDIAVFANELVQLDASASSGIISVGGFAWTQIAGDPVQLGTLQADGTLLVDPLNPPTISMPAFVFPATPQTLTFEVVVSGPGGSTTDTVNVTVDDPLSADVLTPGRARYDGGKSRFAISGTSSVPGPGHSVTCWLGLPTIGLEIGTGAVDAIADWKVDVLGGVNPCVEDPGMAADCDSGAPTIQIHCVSSLGGTLIMDYEARK